jgi:hypothetical protein
VAARLVQQRQDAGRVAAVVVQPQELDQSHQVLLDELVGSVEIVAPAVLPLQLLPLRLVILAEFKRTLVLLAEGGVWVACF